MTREFDRELYAPEAAMIGISYDHDLDKHSIKPSTINAFFEVINDEINKLNIEERLRVNLRQGVLCGFVGFNGARSDFITEGSTVPMPIGFYLPDNIGELKDCITSAASQLSIPPTSRYMVTMRKILFNAFNAALVAEGITPVARLPRQRSDKNPGRAPRAGD